MRKLLFTLGTLAVVTASAGAQATGPWASAGLILIAPITPSNIDASTAQTVLCFVMPPPAAPTAPSQVAVGVALAKGSSAVRTRGT